MVQPIDTQVSDVPDPVADLGAERAPEGKVANVIGGAQADAMELNDAGVAWREVTSTAPHGTCYQSDLISGCVLHAQGRMHVPAATFESIRHSYGKAASAQARADLLQ